MEKEIKQTKSANKRLQQYYNYLLEIGWRILDNGLAQGHLVLRKERLVTNTFNMIGLRVVGNFVFIGISIDGKHSFEANIRDYDHLKSIISEWGNK
jgi:hypothetical protein